jgi:hypothetical protein
MIKIKLWQYTPLNSQSYRNNIKSPQCQINYIKNKLGKEHMVYLISKYIIQEDYGK